MSALGDLFSDIAGAIRYKNGEEGVTYKPAEFPGKIMGIVSATRNVVMKHGTFMGNGGVCTVEHGLSVVPDLLIVYAGHVLTPPAILLSIGYSSALMSAMEDGAVAPTPIYNEYTVATVNNSESMENPGSDNCQTFGVVRSVTNSSFVFGSVDYPATADQKYGYIAFTGLV